MESQFVKGDLKMKKLLALVLSLAMIFSFAACGTENNGSNETPSDTYTPVDINIAGIKGPTAVGMVDLMQKQEDKTAANNYNFSVFGDPQELVGKISTGAVDIAALPTNLAATLYKKTEGKIKVLAVNTYGVLHIVENGETVKSFADLKGKTILSTGEGSNPEYILRYVLENNGINPDTDVTIKFVTSNDEMIAQLKTGGAQIAMVPEPAVTTAMSKIPTLRRVFDMNTEWEKITQDSALMMGCVVVRTEFLEQNPAAVKKFMEEYEASVNAVSDLEKTASLCEKFEIIPAAAVAKKAIPNCHIAFTAGEEMKADLGGYFKVLFEANPKSIGGALPDDNFYYIP